MPLESVIAIRVSQRLRFAFASSGVKGQIIMPAPRRKPRLSAGPSVNRSFGTNVDQLSEPHTLNPYSWAALSEASNGLSLLAIARLGVVRDSRNSVVEVLVVALEVTFVGGRPLEGFELLRPVLKFGKQVGLHGLGRFLVGRVGAELGSDLHDLGVAVFTDLVGLRDVILFAGAAVVTAAVATAAAARRPCDMRGRCSSAQ